MKNKFFIVVLLFTSYRGQAQDFDIYPRLKDENVKMSNVYENTLFDEYQLLSRNIRMMDMAYGAIVPGYVHFKAKDLASGYGILGSRILSVSGLAFNYYHLNEQGLQLKNISNLGSNFNTDKFIFFSSISLIVSSYLFDWIHGKARLEKKQEYIRYKYSIKLNLEQQTFNPASRTSF